MSLSQRGASCKHGKPRKSCTRVRHRETGNEATVSDLNWHGVGEFIAQFDDGSASSEDMSDYEPTCSSWQKIEASFLR